MGATDRPAAEHQVFLDTRYFASLDGLRCLSIVAVIWHHAAGHLPGYFGGGYLAVKLFFVISGFLITTLLLREKEKYGKVSLPDFYLRRTLRIFPLYYAVLALYLVVVLLTPARTSADQQARAGFLHNLPYFATYTSNWFVELTSGPRVIFYFAWSLATEEQFYLLWPCVVALGKNWRLPVFVAVALGAAGMAKELLLPGGASPTGGVLIRIGTSIAPSICLGCLLGYCLHYRRGYRIAFRVLGPAWSAPAALAALAVTAAIPGTPIFGIQLVMVWLVGACCIRPHHLLSPWLGNPVVRYVGTISYGMYLLHMLALNVARRVVPAPQCGPVATFLAALALTIVAAALAYRFYELPFLKLKQRFSRTRVSNGHDNPIRTRRPLLAPRRHDCSPHDHPRRGIHRRAPAPG
jgi:peptidoglycan/LPS O-acetylase OafA/YrhL